MAKDNITYPSLISQDLNFKSPIGIESVTPDIIVDYRNGIVSNAIQGQIATLDFEAKINIDTDIKFTVNWGDEIGTTIIEGDLVDGVWKSFQTNIFLPANVFGPQQIIITDDKGSGYAVNYDIIPIFEGLNTYHKTITEKTFAESIVNLPAKFLPRVGSSDGITEKLTWITPLSNDLTSWSVAFRFNNYVVNAGQLNTVVGGDFLKFVLLYDFSNHISYRQEDGTFMPWDGTGNTVNVLSNSLNNIQNDVIFYSDGTDIHLILNGIDKGYITPSGNTKLFFDKFILGYADDSNGADGNFWDLRFWTSNIGQTEALKYHLDTMTVTPTNWFPDVYSGYDVVGSNHGTSNLDSDYELQGSDYLNTNGYSLWQHDTLEDIQVPFDVNELPINLIPGTNIPSGYIRKRDLLPGSDKHNIYDSLINFNPTGLLDAELDIFDRSNITIQTSASRSSIYYDGTDRTTSSIYHISEIVDPVIYDAFFNPDWKNTIFGKVVLDISNNIIRYDEELNYSEQQTGDELLAIEEYCNIENIYP